MNLKHLSLGVAIGTFLAVIFWLGATPVMSQAVPADFSYGEKNPLGAVTFSHKFHVTEKKLQCPDCHTKIFQMKKMAAASQLTMAKLNAGEFCGKCHDGTKAFSTKDSKACARCHKKK